MTRFVDLQKEKCECAKSLADWLERMKPELFLLEQLGKEYRSDFKSSLRACAEQIHRIALFVKLQRKECNDELCDVFLSAQLDSLIGIEGPGRRRDGALQKVLRAIEGDVSIEDVVSFVRGVLLTVMSQDLQKLHK